MVYLPRENDSDYLGSILDGRLTKLAHAELTVNVFPHLACAAHSAFISKHNFK